jgi:hypothetical protein
MSDSARESPPTATTGSPVVVETEAGKPKKKEKFNYDEQLKKDFNKVFEEISGLTTLQREFLRARWLDQVLWMEGRAAKARNKYYRLRLVTIVGGVIIPALVSLGSVGPGGINPGGNNDNDGAVIVRQVIGWSTFLLSQAVAISAATEQFFNYGERWRHYRRSVELLKSQGWQFFQLSGAYAPYNKSGGHKEAFTLFANHIEEIIQRDVEVYSNQVAQEKQQDKNPNGSEEA